MKKLPTLHTVKKITLKAINAFDSPTPMPPKVKIRFYIIGA